MAQERNGIIEVASSNGFYFTDTRNNDFLVRTTHSDQRVLLGTLPGKSSALAVESNVVTVNSNLVVMQHLGVGTSNPTYQLEVAGNMNITGDIFKSGNTLITDSNTIFSRFNLALPIKQSFLASANQQTFDVTIDGDYVASIKDVEVYINGNKLAYVNSNLSDYSLAYNRNGTSTTFSIELAETAFSGDVIDVTVWPSLSNIYGVNTFVNTSNLSQNFVTSNMFVQTVGIGMSNTAEALSVKGPTIAFSNYGMVRLYSSNNWLGINKAPAYNLDVNGNINFTGNIYKNGQVYIPDLSGVSGTQWGSNSANTILYYYGNVGIGQSNPEYKLDIVTASNAGVNANALRLWTQVEDGVTVDALTLTENAGKAFGRQAITWYNSNVGYKKARLWSEIGAGYAATKFGIDVADSTRVLKNRLTIDVNGSVGIGTEAPQNTLQVYGSNTGELGTAITNASSSSTAYSILRMQNSTADNLVMFLNSSQRATDGGQNTATIRNDAGSLRLQARGGVGGLFVETGTGEVGVATSAPAYTLDVAGDINFTGDLKKSGTSYFTYIPYESYTTATAFSTSNGTHTTGTDGYWDTYLHFASNDARTGWIYNSTSNETDASSQWVEYAVPTGMKQGYLCHLPWTNCRYFDIMGKRSDSNLMFITRVNAYNNQASNVGFDHSGVNIVPIPAVDRYTHIRIQGRVGRYHLAGLAWTKEDRRFSHPTGFMHAHNIVGNFPSLTVDANLQVNSNIGIGKAPTSRLDVSGQIKANSLVVTGSNAYMSMEGDSLWMTMNAGSSYPDKLPYFAWRGDDNLRAAYLGWGSKTSKYMEWTFENGYNLYMNGNVGFGSTTPQTRLHVETTSITTGIAVRKDEVYMLLGNTGGSLNAGSIQVRSSGTSSSIGTSNHRLCLNPTGGGVSINTSNNNWQFVTEGTTLLSSTRVVIGDNGDYRGICTVNDTHASIFSSNADIGDANRNLVVQNPTASNAAGNYTSITMQINPTSGTARCMGDIKFVREAADTRQAAWYWTIWNNAGTFNDILKIGKDLSYMPGNLALGGTAASYKLHTYGSIYADGGWFRVSGNQGIYWETWGGGWFMQDADWVRAYNNKSIYTGGNVHFEGQLKVGTDRWHISADGKSRLWFATNGRFYLRSPDGFEFRNDADAYIAAIDNSGNFYCNGTLGSGGRLTVPSATINGNITFGAVSGYGLRWGLNSDGAEISYYSGGDATGSSYLYINTSDNLDEPILFAQTGSERMRIHTNGRVGIGQAAPYYGLQVNTGPANDWAVQFGTGAYCYMGHNNGYGMHINTYNVEAGKYAMELHNNTKQLFVVWNNGYSYFNGGDVGVNGRLTANGVTMNGTSYANGKLVIQNGTDGTNARGIWMWTDGDSNWGIYMATAAAGKSLGNGTSTGGYGFSSYAIRFRVYANAGNGFIFEDSAETNLFSIRASDGYCYARYQLHTGTYLGTGGGIYADGTGWNGWISAILSAGGGDRVVTGRLNGYACIGAHDSTLANWRPLNICPGGNCGIGVDNPGYKLQINGSTYSYNWVRIGNSQGIYSENTGAIFYPNDAQYGNWKIDSGNAINGWNGLRFTQYEMSLMMNSDCGFHKNGDGWRLYVDASNNLYIRGDITAFYSDRRLKKDFEPIQDYNAILDAITGYRFKWNEKGQKLTSLDADYVDIGLIAQDVQKVVPQAIKVNKAGKSVDGKEDDDFDYLTINYDKLVPVLVEATKDLRQQVQEKDARINELEKKVEDLQQKMLWLMERFSTA